MCIFLKLISYKYLKTVTILEKIALIREVTSND